MTVLDDLRRGGRTVGVVSHVEELRTRIPSRIEIRTGRKGSSVGRLSRPPGQRNRQHGDPFTIAAVRTGGTYLKVTPPVERSQVAVPFSNCWTTVVPDCTA